MKQEEEAMELTRTEKVGVHASILFLAMVARNHNQRGNKWFHKVLSGIYLGVEVIEAICIVNDLREEPCLISHE